MSSARETVLIAQDLYERVGPVAIELADERSGALREVGNVEAAQFWRDVCRAMILIATRPSTIRHAPCEPGSNPTWSLMQRIEGYRHLASEAEAVTDAISDAGPEIERLAQGWRELAATFEQLAQVTADIAPPEPFSGTIYELN
jgi:hypothetical protein